MKTSWTSFGWTLFCHLVSVVCCMFYVLIPHVVCSTNIQIRMPQHIHECDGEITTTKFSFSFKSMRPINALIAFNRWDFFQFSNHHFGLISIRESIIQRWVHFIQNYSKRFFASTPYKLNATQRDSTRFVVTRKIYLNVWNSHFYISVSLRFSSTFFLCLRPSSSSFWTTSLWHK